MANSQQSEPTSTLRQFCRQHREGCMFASSFSRSAFFVKTTSEWAAMSKRRGVESAAKRFARDNMIAVVMLGNDDAVAYLYDAANNRVAKQVYRQPEWVA